MTTFDQVRLDPRWQGLVKTLMNAMETQNLRRLTDYVATLCAANDLLIDYDCGVVEALILSYNPGLHDVFEKWSVLNKGLHLHITDVTQRRVDRWGFPLTGFGVKRLASVTYMLKVSTVEPLGQQARFSGTMILEIICTETDYLYADLTAFDIDFLKPLHADVKRFNAERGYTGDLMPTKQRCAPVGISGSFYDMNARL